MNREGGIQRSREFQSSARTRHEEAIGTCGDLLPTDTPVQVTHLMESESLIFEVRVAVSSQESLFGVIHRLRKMSDANYHMIFYTLFYYFK